MSGPGAAKRTLQATLPDGRVVHRMTDHDYKYVVCILHAPESWHAKTYNDGKPFWGGVRWTSTLPLAETERRKQLAISAKYPDVQTDVLIVPVEA